jgi:hypothetical protein
LKHGVADEQNTVLSFLRNIAHASTDEQYEEAVENLKTNRLWLENLPLQQWFTRTWLSQYKVRFQ